MFQKPTGERRLLEVSGHEPYYRISITYCGSGKVSEMDNICHSESMPFLQEQGQILVSRGFIPEPDFEPVDMDDSADGHETGRGDPQ